MGLAESVHLFVADATAIPLAEGAVSGAACGEVLEHLGDDAAAVCELARVLQPGGVLAVTVPAGTERYGRADRVAGHYRRYDADGLEALLRAGGFRVLSLQWWGFPFGRLYDRLLQRAPYHGVGPSGPSSGTPIIWPTICSAIARTIGLGGAGPKPRGSGAIAIAARTQDR
jgi:SAM-dependent methyltransferase